MSSHASFKHTDYVLVVWVLFKFKLAAILHELFKFRWISAAEFLQRGLHLFLFDVIVLVILGLTWETLPRERASQEIQEHMANSLEIISSRLLYTFVCVDTGVSCCAR